MTSRPDDLQAVLEVIRARREVVRGLGVDLVGVVGSIARGEAREDSDADIVYDVVGRPSLLDLGRIALDLETALGRSVDLVSRQALRPDRWTHMSRDLVLA